MKSKKLSKAKLKILKKYLVFLFFGLVLVFSGAYLSYARTVLSFGYTPEVTTQPQKISLQSIAIPKIGINLQIKTAVIENGIWQISPDSASHLSSSALPGEGDNIVIYAHNKRALFGPLLWVNLGDEVTLYADNNQKFKYQITEIKTVKPDDIEVVLPKNEEILTLYTCSGFLDRERHIVIAKPSI